jgi:hypothetical protein
VSNLRPTLTAAVRTCLACVVFTLLALASSSTARAQSALPGTPSGQPAARELAATRDDLERALAELRTAQTRANEADALRAALAHFERQLGDSSAALNSCQTAKEQLCSATGAFANGLSAGRVDAGGLGPCVGSVERRQLAQQLSGWTNVAAALGQLAAFSSGESDVAAGIRASSGTKAEQLMGRLFAQGNATPLIFRRLLIEAIRQLAPQFLRKLRSKPGNTDRWLAGVEPLDAALVDEAYQGATVRAVDTRAPATLATATSLVNAYELLAGCGTPEPARECRRAEQLRQMLESSGPLIARRRVQDVWASDCATLNDGVVQRWFEDLPPGQSSAAQLDGIVQAIQSKLLTCFLRDATAGDSFSAWLATLLPLAKTVERGAVARVLEVESWWKSGSDADRCARAVRAIQTLPMPRECNVSDELASVVGTWALRSGHQDQQSTFALAVCDRLGRALWKGASATLPGSFPGPPTVDDAVHLLAEAPRSNMSRLRSSCQDRLGGSRGFPAAVRKLATLGRGLGEDPALPPWRLAPTLEPRELEQARRGVGAKPWLSSMVEPYAACSVLQLSPERCAACGNLPDGSRYDCSLLADLQQSWQRKTRALVLWLLSMLALALLLAWGLRLKRASSAHGSWLAETRRFLQSIGLEPKSDRLRYLLPSRFSQLVVRLPETPAWERWGRSAAVIRSDRLQARDVNRAALAAKACGAELALLVHEDESSPELGAVRAILELAARASGKAAHVVPLPWSRLKWSRSVADLLDLADESSLRNNPFELRGRVTSSAQFFNRERLVSGLLAGAEAGRFTVLTGLRRFGKSSLALEVARRLPGPSAYVDLAGFHHEIRFSVDPADAVDAILRFVCLKLVESARARSSSAVARIAVPTGKMDAAGLAAWFRDFSLATVEKEGAKAPPALVILDELEQAIGAARRLDHALDVLAILVGRLRNCLPNSLQEGRQRVGVLFCSALHPLLWCPLGTLAHQSLIGSFDYAAVPCLPDDAAASMMRGLGSRQGIRFTTAALDLLVRESQSVPLLLRRLGTAVLELYDPDRARQGGLGAVEIGVEGVRAAIEHEQGDGSPLRVWIETEIAEAGSPTGVVLRGLAEADRRAARDLRQLAARSFAEQFEVVGLGLALTPQEVDRRARDAAAVVMRILGESGLLQTHGDPTDPEEYELPEGVIRRVLQSALTRTS